MIGVSLDNYGGVIEYLLGIKDDEVYVGMEAPKGDGWVQDNDVLDTWFSSALMAIFSTLGWPDNTDLLKRYYPNNVLSYWL